MSYVLRLVLPDRPGSLGAVATALGTLGADILALDIVERSVGHAVDDLHSSNALTIASSSLS